MGVNIANVTGLWAEPNGNGGVVIKRGLARSVEVPGGSDAHHFYEATRAEYNAARGVALATAVPPTGADRGAFGGVFMTPGQAMWNTGLFNDDERDAMIAVYRALPHW